MSNASRPLWTPGPVWSTTTRMAAFTDHARALSGADLGSYANLHAWSIAAPERLNLGRG